MADNARGIHVSPGIYSREIEITNAVKSLGITTLGLVGETVKGPAFQPMLIENWRDFQNMFGGTNPERFKGSKYPKYELPYIAKSYLTQSKQLQVCRVLGLSGYNAGPAWAITGEVNGQKMVIAIIRSRGHYEKYYKYSNSVGSCECQLQSYDQLIYEVGEKSFDISNGCQKPSSYNGSALKISVYTRMDNSGNDCAGYTTSGNEFGWGATISDYGRFCLEGVVGYYPDEDDSDGDIKFTSESDGYFKYAVSLNENDNDYILKVLGSSAENGDAPIYVESLYDVAWKQQVAVATTNLTINNSLEYYQVYYPYDYGKMQPITDLMYMQEEQLSRKDLGKRFLATKYNVDNNFHCHVFDYKTNKPIYSGITPKYTYNVGTGKATVNGTYTIGIKMTGSPDCPDCGEVETPQVVKVGRIYTVAQYTDESGKRHYYYRYYNVEFNEEGNIDDSVEDGYVKYMVGKEAVSKEQIFDKLSNQTTQEPKGCYIVKSNADSLYYRMNNDNTDVAVVKIDLNNYKSAFRFASTPWIVSNVKGDYKNIELNRLFRFHTISDGNNSNYLCKISIANIKPEEGTFDVIVRDINDTDESVVALEKYSKCSLVPGTSNYLGLKIGTFDGAYESKSKYITVEINENDITKLSIPCGFLGYPIHDYSGLPIKGAAKTDVVMPYLKYNLDYDIDIKNRKQYFGLSNHVGVDIDAFTFKGNMSYYDDPSYICQGFHLDSRLDMNSYNGDDAPKITVDNIEGYTFDAVSLNNRTTILTEMPIIGKETEMIGSIYENVDLRKFTVYFYGGFDGWDVYRDERSNGDDFKQSKYKGAYNDASGEGYSFDKITDPSALGLDEAGITSDYYAYLSGIRQFANPESVDINVFATPGIDYVNQKSLVDEAIEMIEQERADSIYVVTTPDKPSGAEDYVDEMYTPDDVVYNLEDSDIDSNYTCTYYPWIKYFDSDNNQYINLPATKDVVRNMAMTDNVSYSWYAPAGYTRGNVDCVKAHYVTKLADEDTLYEGRINPIKTFAQDGVKVWGQKNLQKTEGQLNRISVRRLLLRIRKMISIACIKLIFEPNDATTKNKFLSLVTPILDNVRSNRGISDYRVEVDDSVEARDRRELPAKIFIKPINALEYIVLDFIVTPESVSFDDI